MPDYSKAIVYKLCCKDMNITDIYVGSTCNFSRRKCHHKNACNNEKHISFNLKVYQFIRENNGFDNWTMTQIEAYPECTNKRELGQFERYHIEQLKPALNCQIPTRTRKERDIDNKEILKEKNKQYREQNKEIITEKNKDYYEQNREKLLEKNKEKIVCECGSEITKTCVIRHKKSKKHLASINC